MHDILDILKNIKKVYTQDMSVRLLTDFERVLDDLDLYVYANWENGELVEGPIENRHTVSSKFMWPKDEMPDPEGGLRLTKKDIKVKFTEDTFKYPKRITGPEDIEVRIKKNRVYRVTKTNEDPVWLVELKIPRKFVEKIDQDYILTDDDNISIDDANAGADLTGGLDSNNMELNPTASDLGNDIEI